MRRTVAFHTFGCKVNQYETEELRTALRMGGFDVVSAEGRADVFVVNSCTVTADADSSCRQLLRQLLRDHPDSRVVVTGCYAERMPEELGTLSPRLEVFGNRDKPMIALSLGVPTACVEAAANSGVTALAERSRAFIKIQDGCDAHCTYCIIPSVRSALICREPDLVLREAQNLIDQGFRELVLTGVRLGRYVSGDWDFTRLLSAMMSLRGDYRIRLSSIEVTEIPDAVIEMAASNDRLCPFFHIPLQSGDETVLKRMGRWYTVRDYRRRLEDIRRKISDVAFSGDVIAGFPGEDDTAFKNTYSLLQEERFSRLHAFRFSVRPGTPAERLPNKVDGRLKAERVRRLVALDADLRRRYAEQFVGRDVRMLHESGGTGYTAHYVRASLPAVTPASGAWVQSSGRAVSADGILTLA